MYSYKFVILLGFLAGTVPSTPVSAQKAAELPGKVTEKQARRNYYANQSACIKPKVWAAGKNEAVLRACNAALFRPSGVDEHWSKPSQIHQQLAFLFYSDARYPEALSALEDSDKLGEDRNDFLFDNSVKLGNNLLRALIFNKMGKQAEAFALLDSLRKKRPYAISIIRRIEAVQNAIIGDPKQNFARMDGRLKLEPDLIQYQMTLKIANGDLQAAYDLSNKVFVVDDPAEWGDESKLDPVYRQLSKKNEHELLRAYLAAAISNTAESERLIAKVKSDTTAYVGDGPQPEKPGGRVTKKQQQAYDQRKKFGNWALDSIDRWILAIKIRKDAATLDGGTFLQAIVKDRILHLPIGIDLRRQLKFADPTLKEANDKGMAEINDIAQSVLSDIRSEDLQNIKIPAEYLDQVPKFGKSVIFKSAGYSQVADNYQGTHLVRFKSFSASQAMAEELALRTAALITRETGKDSFVIRAQKTITRTIQYYGARRDTLDSGYEIQLRITMLDANSDHSQWQDRIINAQTILDHLEPQFTQLRDEQ